MKVRPVTPVIQRERQMMTKKALQYIPFYLIFLISGALTLHAQEKQIVSCKISYISKDNVYVDKGKNAGLTVGDTLIVKRDGENIASLKILYTANHSSSCEIVNFKENVRVGDVAECKILPDTKNLALPSVVAAKEEAINQKKKTSKPFARISGGLSLQWFHFEDQSENNLHFDQPTLRFDLKAKELWGKKYNFIIKMRLRKNQRARSYSKNIPEAEWRNRIYTFYFSYEDINSPINFRIGRILSPNLRGVGYLDGGQIQHNINRDLSWGIYGGLQSSWQFETTQDSLHKYGAYISYTRGNSGSNKFSGTLAYNAMYHGSTVSRQNFYLQSNFSSNNLYIFQSMEVDVNTSWRREKEARDISFTSFYLSAKYKFSKTLRTGLSYDNRKNFYRYETREMTEDLFDLAFRHGLNADLLLALPKDYSTSLRIGIKKREDDSETTYIGRLTLKKNNIFYKYWKLNLNINGYTNYYTEGWIPSIYISKQFTAGHYLSLSSGMNNYIVKLDGQNRDRYWIRLNGHFQLFGNMYLSGFYSQEWGDDFVGYRVLAEIGYRF